MPPCQYIHPITGERCDTETDYWIQVGPVHLAVCAGEHAEAMKPGGRNRAQMQREADEYERHQRHKAEARGFVGPPSHAIMQMPGGNFIWPDVER